MMQMEPEVDNLEYRVAESQSASQGSALPLPTSQNECSSQQANIGTCLLTPVQRARMAYQKEIALAKYRDRQRQHHQIPQRHHKLTMAFPPCNQLPTTQAQREPAADMLSNITVDIQTISQVCKSSQIHPFLPTSCFYQDRHSFTQAKSDGSDSYFYQERHSFTQAKPTYTSGSCYPNFIFQSGSAASLTQSNTIYHSGAPASFTEPNLGKKSLTRSPGGTFEVADVYAPVLTSLSDEDGRIKVKHECHQAGKEGGKGADIIELSDDDGVTGKAVVIEVSDDDNSVFKADIMEVSRVDGASQEVTSFATLGGIYQKENRVSYDRSYKHTNSKTEQDLADDTKQYTVYTNHELVRSAAGFIYYRMQGLEDDRRKGTNMCKSELLDLEENKDHTFIPLTVLPSTLSKQQQLVLEAAAAGKCIFLTGAAGTGKSFLLGFVIDILRTHLGQQSVFVTASTGLAACALNGTTIHSFAGIGLGKEKPDLLASKVLGSREAMNRWRNARALIIDEVSMIDGELFDKLDHVAKVARAEFLRDEPLNKSFGGVQLIVTGDFFQLPPVKPGNQQKFFAFEADCWEKCFDVQVELKQIFRQDDGNLVDMLNKIRRGTHTPETLLPLQECVRDLPENSSGIKATRLYPLKQDVNEENISTLRMLNREIVEFTALDKASSSYYRSMLQHMRAGSTVPLCIGAQVMLVKNLDTNSGLVNGARGVVVGFSSQSVLHDKDVDLKAVTAAISPNGQWPVVQFVCDASQRVIGPHKDSIEDGGWEVASRVQVPLILAWALSVHKCQGMTLDRVKMDLSRAFGFGMVYVALSRVKKLDGLQLIGLNPSTIKAHPRVVQFYKKLDSKILTC